MVSVFLLNSIKSPDDHIGTKNKNKNPTILEENWKPTWSQNDYVMSSNPKIDHLAQRTVVTEGSH